MAINENHEQQAAQALSQIIRLLGLQATVTAEGKDDTIALTVASDEAGRIIGRKGRTLSAIQLLLNSILRKDSSFDARIQINIDGYEKPVHKRGFRDGASRHPDDVQAAASPMADFNETAGEENGAAPEFKPVDSSPAASAATESDAPARDQRRERQPRENRRDRDYDRRERGRDRRDDRRGGRDRRGDRGGGRDRRYDRGGGRDRRDGRGSGRGRREDRRDNRAERGRPHERQEAAESLERARQQAIDAAKEVKRWGESVTLPYMTERECQAARDILADDAAVQVADEGEPRDDGRRRIKVILAPEA